MSNSQRADGKIRCTSSNKCHIRSVKNKTTDVLTTTETNAQKTTLLGDQIEIMCINKTLRNQNEINKKSYT